MLNQRHIDTFVVEHIEDTTVPREIVGFEELPNLARTILEKCPVVVCGDLAENQPVLPFDPLEPEDIAPSYTLSQVSQYHARSFLVSGEGLERRWTDEFGNQYQGLTLKGNNMAHSELIETATALNRYIGYGLQESAVMSRVLRASRVLREAGVSTEYIVGLAEPKRYQPRIEGLPVGEEQLTIQAFRHYLVERRWNGLPIEERTVDAYVDIVNKLDAMTFYISLRTADTPIRLQDVMDYEEARKDAFRDINEHHLEPGQEPFEDSYDGIIRYAREFLAPRLAGNLAKMHAAGLAHVHPVALNVTALGGIVDLDSVHGAPLGLGDDPISEHDIAKDVFRATQQSILQRGFLASAFGEYRELGPTEVFISAYFKQLEEQFTRYDRDEDVTTKIINIASACIEYCNDSEVEDHNTHALRKSLHAVIEEKAIDSTCLKPMAQLWLADNDEILKARLNDYLATNIEKICDNIVFGMQLDDKLSFGDATTPYETLFRDIDDFGGVSAREMIFRDLACEVFDGVLKECFNKHLSGILAVGIDSELLSPLAADMITTAASFEDGANFVLDEWLDKNIDAALEGLKDQINKNAVPKKPELLFSDYHSDAVAVLTGRNLVMETTEVPFDVVLQHIKTVDPEQIRMLPLDSAKGSFLSPEHVVSQGYRLEQIVSDDFLSMSSPEYIDELELGTFAFEPAACQFVLFIEVDPVGTRKYTLYTKSKEQSQTTYDWDNTPAVAAAVEHGLTAGTLFDPRRYDKNSARWGQNSSEIEILLEQFS